MDNTVCYQYFHFGQCIWMKTLYERPVYPMDCVVKWRIKEKGVIQQSNELFSKVIKTYIAGLPEPNVNYWNENKNHQK